MIALSSNHFIKLWWSPRSSFGQDCWEQYGLMKTELFVITHWALWLVGSKWHCFPHLKLERYIHFSVTLHYISWKGKLLQSITPLLLLQNKKQSYFALISVMWWPLCSYNWSLQCITNLILLLFSPTLRVTIGILNFSRNIPSISDFASLKWFFRKQVWEGLLFHHDNAGKNKFFLPFIALGVRPQSKCQRQQQQRQHQCSSWGRCLLFTFPHVGRIVQIFTCRYVKCLPLLSLSPMETAR